MSVLILISSCCASLRSISYFSVQYQTIRNGHSVNYKNVLSEEEDAKRPCIGSSWVAVLMECLENKYSTL